MSNTKSNSGGVSVWSLLLVTFVVMKLAGIGAVASWSWWWVLSPFWIPRVLAVVLVVIVTAVFD